MITLTQGVLKIILIYLLIINLITFIAFAVDKFKAKHNMWRIPERTLFTLSIIGGSVGGIIAMQLVRHKTQTFSFKFGMPIILILQILISILIFA